MVRLVIAPEKKWLSVDGDGWGWWHLTTLWWAESAGGHPKGPAAFLAPHSGTEEEEEKGREREREREGFFWLFLLPCDIVKC